MKVKILLAVGVLFLASAFGFLVGVVISLAAAIFVMLSSPFFVCCNCDHWFVVMPTWLGLSLGIVGANFFIGESFPTEVAAVVFATAVWVSATLAKVLDETGFRACFLLRKR